MSNKIDWLLFLLCLIPFGFDKLYRGDGKMFVIKLLTHIVGIGFLWWIYDVICVLIGKYKINPLDNFR